MKLQSTSQGGLVRLQPGDKVQASLRMALLQLGYKAAWVTGIGVVNEVELGFFEMESKNYVRKLLPGSWEICSLTGNLSFKEGIPFCHAHVSLSGPDFAMVGGHLFEATIHAAGECLLTPLEFPLTRSQDPETGLFLWDY